MPYSRTRRWRKAWARSLQRCPLPPDAPAPGAGRGARRTRRCGAVPCGSLLHAAVSSTRRMLDDRRQEGAKRCGDTEEQQCLSTTRRTGAAAGLLARQALSPQTCPVLCRVVVAAATAPVTDSGLQTTVAHHSTTIYQGALSMA